MLDRFVSDRRKRRHAEIEALDQLDELVQQTFEKLKAPGDVERVREKPLAAGAGIEYSTLPSSGDESG